MTLYFRVKPGPAECNAHGSAQCEVSRMDRRSRRRFGDDVRLVRAAIGADSVIQPLTVLACQQLDLLFVQDDVVEEGIAGLKGPISFAVLCEHPIEKPALLVSVVQDSDRTEDDHAGVDEGRIAGERMPVWVPEILRTDFRKF